MWKYTEKIKSKDFFFFSFWHRTPCAAQASLKLILLLLGRVFLQVQLEYFPKASPGGKSFRAHKPHYQHQDRLETLISADATMLFFFF